MLAEDAILRTPLAFAAGDVVHVWNLLDSDPPKTFGFPGALEKTQVSDVAWNHNGQVLAVAGIQNGDDDQDSIAMWSFQSQKLLQVLGKDVIKKPRSVLFGGKSRYLCIATGSTVVVWDLKKQTAARKIRCQSNVIRCCIRSPDSTVYALCEQELQLFGLRDVSSKGMTFNLNGAVDYAFKPGTSTIAVATSSNVVHFFDTAQIAENLIQAHESCPTPALPVQLQYINDDHLLVLLTSSCCVYKAGTMFSAINVAPDDDATCMSFHAGFLAIGFRAGKVQVYDTATWQVHSSHQVRRSITGMAWSPIAAPRSPSNVKVTSLEVQVRPAETGPSPHLPFSNEYQSIGVDGSMPDNPVRDSSPDLTLLAAEVRRLRNDMQISLQALHLDMLQQFQKQVTDMNHMQLQQIRAIDQLALENRELRMQVEKLQHAQQQESPGNRLP